jgi:low temperature requirement protein LtrA
MQERRTSPVELLWDLVFVFSVTQVTTLITNDLTWAGLGHGLIVLALVWWAWSAFVWAANAEEERSRTLHAILLAGMLLVFVAGLALPSAFSGKATLFAVCYAAVRFLHLGMYAHAAREGNASWTAINSFAFTVVIGMTLIVAGSFLPEGWQVASWTIALLIDYAGPAWLTRERLRGLQQVAIAHFAERYGLFVIICLGESIVAIGLSADAKTIDTWLVTAVAFGLATTVCLWWMYFDRFAGIAEERLRGHDDVVLAAADSYSYLHLVIVAGIIVFAVGMKVAIHDVTGDLPEAARLALCGGLALYFAGNALFRLRLVGAVANAQLAGVLGMLAVFAFGAGHSTVTVTALATAVVVAVCALDSIDGRAHEQGAALPAEVDRPTGAGHNGARADEHA